MLGSLLHFETKKRNKQSKKNGKNVPRNDGNSTTSKQQRRRQRPISSNQHFTERDNKSSSLLKNVTKTWQANSKTGMLNENSLSHQRQPSSSSVSFSNFRDRSRSFDTFDAAGRKRSLSHQDVAAAVSSLISLNRSYGSKKSGSIISIDYNSSRGTNNGEKITGIRRSRLRRNRANSARNLYQTTVKSRKHSQSQLNDTPRNHSTAAGSTSYRQFFHNQLKITNEKSNTIHGIFEQQVLSSSSTKTAIICSDGKRLSFLKLNQMANRLARYLLKLGIPFRSTQSTTTPSSLAPLQCVGVCSSGHWSIVCMLAIMKTGKIYFIIFFGMLSNDGIHF
jgi:hypothetical protein